MHLRSLELRHWRNYEHAVIELGSGVHLLTGANGQGKTNILEAVHYLAVGRSHRVADDRSLIRADASEALVRTDVEEADRRHRLQMTVSRVDRNRARVDGTDVPRREALGYVRMVMFSPEDLVLVRGDPADRRRFLDDLLAQRRPAYRTARQEYERVLRQRNALLRDVRHGSAHDDGALAAWSEELIRLGARIVAARLMACAALQPLAAACYAELTDTSRQSHGLGLTLQRSTGKTGEIDPGAQPDMTSISHELRAAISARSEEEHERGTSLVGPHRDDVHVELDGLPVKTHASQGEAWSVALALRLASRELLRSPAGEPITLLDDVFAQLDEDRRRRLATSCAQSEQVLVSAAVPEDVPLSAQRLHITGGSIQRVSHHQGHHEP